LNFLNKLLLKHTPQEMDSLTKDYCPNCWGDQKYENVIREKFKDPQIDVNNGEANYAFVQKFMVTHLNGIKLKSMSAGVGCPRCKMKTSS
jgi:hypothetical protein